MVKIVGIIAPILSIVAYKHIFELIPGQIHMFFHNPYQQEELL